MKVHRRENVGPDVGEDFQGFLGNWEALNDPEYHHSKTQGPIPGQLPQTAAGCTLQDSQHGLVG